MSLLKNALAKNYIGDIYEASYGFFCSVADEIEFVNPNKISHAEKFRLADRYGMRYFSTPDIDNYFKKYLKYNRYDIMGELELENPFIKDVIDVYANEKKIYATLVMNLRLDVSKYIANEFYEAIKPERMFSYFEEESDIKIVSYYIQVEFKIDNILKDFKIKSVSKYKPKRRIPKNGLSYDNNMVPNIDFETMAKKIRDKYGVTTPIDIEKLLYETGLNVDTSFSLDDKTHGLICLFDGYIKSYNQIYLIKENTILIDREHIKNYGIGSYRFNILHEIVHFEYHKYYLTLKRQLAGFYYIVIDKEATLKNIEDQANKVASLLLVPSDELSKMLIDNYIKYDFYFAENKSEILIKISNSLSKYFNCSKTCMHQRIKAIGFYTADIDTQEYSRTYKAKYFDSDEFFAHRIRRYYLNNTIFGHKKLVKRA